MSTDTPTPIQSEFDVDFRHHLYDTLILLGCPKQIAGLLKKSEDGWISEDDVDALRRYNGSLIDGLKDRLTAINTVTLDTKGCE